MHLYSGEMLFHITPDMQDDVRAREEEGGRGRWRERERERE